MATEPELAGRTIVLTRPDTGSLGERLAELGAIVEHVPLIEIGPPSDGGAALFAELEHLDTYDWLVVTSANGARQVAAAAGRHPGVRVAAVGAATASVVEAVTKRRPVDLVPDIASAEGLLAAFPRGAARILVAHGNLAGDRLPNGLRALGHDVVTVEAYTTTKQSPTFEELNVLRRADAIVLASGSAVSAWKSADPDLATGACIVTIGPKTAEAARAAGLTVAATAESPTDDAVIAALVESQVARATQGLTRLSDLGTVDVELFVSSGVPRRLFALLERRPPRWRLDLDALRRLGWTDRRGGLQPPPDWITDVDEPHPYSLGPQWEGTGAWHATFTLASGESVEGFVENELLVDQADDCDPGPPLGSESPWRWRLVGLPGGLRCGRAENPVHAAAAAESVVVAAGCEPFERTATRRGMFST